MSGISAIASKLKNIGKKTKSESEKVSVVYFGLDGKIDWPENCNDGVFAVSKKMTMEEWENADFSK